MNDGGGDERAGGRPARYRDLAARAATLIAQYPEGVTDADMIRALFGAEAGGPWERLLAVVLGGDPRLKRHGDRWLLAAGLGARPGLPPPDAITTKHTDAVRSRAATDEIVAMTLLTTGADPRRHRIARIAMIRRAGSDITERFDVVLRLERRPARFVRDAGGLNDDDMETAPAFAEIADHLWESVGQDAIYCYGADRTRAFLAAECCRADLPQPAADLREVDTLVGSVVGSDRKPGLRAAAAMLGVHLPARPSPLAEADLIARIVERVRDQQAASPPRGAVVESHAEKAADAATGTKLPFTRNWLAGVPEGPGIYVIEAEDGAPLYVGKAVALRRRLASYVRQPPSSHRQFEALGVRAALVRTQETPSDLEATLLEACLIRELMPPFNVSRATRPPAVYLRADAHGRLPRVRPVPAPAADGATYFGPFASVRAARHAASIAQAVYSAAFLRRRTDPDQQRTAVLDVCRLLAGQKAPAIDTLRMAMRAAAGRSDQSEVDRLRAALRAVQAFAVEASVLVGRGTGWRIRVVETQPDGRQRAHVIADGLLVRSCDVWPDDDDPDVDSSHPPPEDRPVAARLDPVTERAIVLRWLAQTRGRLTVTYLPPTV